MSQTPGNGPENQPPQPTAELPAVPQSAIETGQLPATNGDAFNYETDQTITMDALPPTGYAQGDSHEKAHRLGIMERRELVQSLGELMLDHNKNVDSQRPVDPETGLRTHGLRQFEREHAARRLRVDAKAYNKKARSLNWNQFKGKVLPGSRSADLEEKIAKHNNEKFDQVTDTESRFEALEPRTHGRLKLQRDVAYQKTRVRYAEAAADGFDPQAIPVPDHLLQRSQDARARREGSTDSSELPVTREELPESLRSDQAARIIRDVRTRVSKAGETARKQALAAGEQYDPATAKKALFNRLMSANFYKQFGSDELGLRNPDNFALIEQLLEKNDEEFDSLFPATQEKKRVEPLTHLAQLATQQALLAEANLQEQRQAREEAQEERERGADRLDRLAELAERQAKLTEALLEEQRQARAEARKDSERDIIDAEDIVDAEVVEDPDEIEEPEELSKPEATQKPQDSKDKQ